MHTKYDAFAASLFTVSYIKLKITRFLSVGLFWLCVFFVVKSCTWRGDTAQCSFFFENVRWSSNWENQNSRSYPSCVKLKKFHASCFIFHIHDILLISEQKFQRDSSLQRFSDVSLWEYLYFTLSSHTCYEHIALDSSEMESSPH